MEKLKTRSLIKKQGSGLTANVIGDDFGFGSMPITQKRRSSLKKETSQRINVIKENVCAVEGLIYC